MKQIITSSALSILLLILVNPFIFEMTEMFMISCTVIAVVLFIIFALMVLNERGLDEREQQHTAFAGRISYIVGSSVLLIGIVNQLMHHIIDVWLVSAFIAMLVSKVFALYYSRLHK